MKYNGEEKVLFEDDEILEDLASKYFVVKNKMKSKEIKKAPTDTNLIEIFKEHYSTTFDIEEMIEFRNFMENDYPDWKMDNVREETKDAEIINLKELGLE
jgi:hypothetical protein